VSQLTRITVCPIEDLEPGQSRIVDASGEKVGVFNCDGKIYAIEDRCSHDDGPLAEGTFDHASCTVECPRHGSLFDLRSGQPRTLPAYAPVETYEVHIEDGQITLEVD
jgi:3-phenylpropionate/trans-cinnamate dioxygenase ferredoxin component